MNGDDAARRSARRVAGELARQVFTHASWSERRSDSYARLAFLGDSVLALAVTTHLYPRLEAERFGAGRLTKIRAQAVSGVSCRAVAERLALPERLRAAAPAGVQDSAAALVETERVLASVIEAVIGACYLHAGYERTAEAVVEAFGPEIEEALEHPGWTSSPRCRSCWLGAARRSATVSRARTGRRTSAPTRSSLRSTAHSSEPGAAGARSTPSRRPRARPSTGWRARSGVRLKSLTLKGFKSFPDRTRLDFGPGVSVVVGPNGSGKSNVTDAVLWAMGEQSPLAVRGQSMQDVIFGGGRGVQARSAAEVEIVLDNSDGAVDLPLSEISIVRRLDRAGEGGYRLNGARCRLTDVIEVLSDTGLGKETHSVISQGRVEQIVTSKPRERRLLIEEAAGLGKHRKRRRRAQLKLERTQENLDRALDVEREARTRLRPLKRQAEAAELHERLERQMLEARLELARDSSRTRAADLGGAEERVSRARAARAEVDGSLQAMIDRRGLAERALAERAERHDTVARRVYDARSARERLELRAEQAGASAEALARRAGRIELELQALAKTTDLSDEGDGGTGSEDRIAALEGELAEIETKREQEITLELSELQGESEREAARLKDLEGELGSARDARARADGLLEKAREGSVWSSTWDEVRRVIVDGVKRVLAQPDERARTAAAGEVANEAEHVARGVVEYALKGVRAAEEVREEAEAALREAERRWAEAGEQQRRTEWLIAQRRAAPQQGPLAVRRAQLEGELAAERRQAERLARERSERATRRGAERPARRRRGARTSRRAPHRRPEGSGGERFRAGGATRSGARHRQRRRRGDGGRAARVRRRGGRDPNATARSL